MLELTVAQIRNLSGTLADNVFFTTDAGKQGLWQYDSTDTTSADNLGTILVTTDGKRIKRVYDGIINITWFGGIGNGTTDNTAAIVAAIKAGNDIFFPKGLYKVLSPIETGTNANNDKYVNFSGSGIDVTGLNGTCIVGSGISIFRIRHQKGGRITDMAIHDSAGSTATIAVEAGGTSGMNTFSMSNVLIDGAFGLYRGIGIQLTFTLKSSFVNVTVQEWDTGIKTVPVGTAPNDDKSNANSWVGCRFRSCNTGLLLYRVDDQFFQGCTVEGNSIGAILDSSVSNFSSCHFENGRSSRTNVQVMSGSILYSLNCTYSDALSYKDVLIDSGGQLYSQGDVLNSGITNNSTITSLLLAPRFSVAMTGTGQYTLLEQNQMISNLSSSLMVLDGFYGFQFNDLIIANSADIIVTSSDGSKLLAFEQSAVRKGIIGLEPSITGNPGNDLGLCATNNNGISLYTAAGKVFNVNNNGVTSILGLSVYANNAAALTAGLTAGNLYRTATGQVMVVY